MAGNSGLHTTADQRKIGADKNIGIREKAKQDVSAAMASVPTFGGLKKDFSGTEQPRTTMKTTSSSKKWSR